MKSLKSRIINYTSKQKKTPKKKRKFLFSGWIGYLWKGMLTRPLIQKWLSPTEAASGIVQLPFCCCYLTGTKLSSVWEHAVTHLLHYLDRNYMHNDYLITVITQHQYCNKKKLFPLRERWPHPTWGFAITNEKKNPVKDPQTSPWFLYMNLFTFTELRKCSVQSKYVCI